jgi:hypothetical protein
LFFKHVASLQVVLLGQAATTQLGFGEDGHVSEWDASAHFAAAGEQAP